MSSSTASSGTAPSSSRGPHLDADLPPGPPYSQGASGPDDPGDSSRPPRGDAGPPVDGGPPEDDGDDETMVADAGTSDAASVPEDNGRNPDAGGRDAAPRPPDGDENGRPDAAVINPPGDGGNDNNGRT